jgi:hypothetical protein
LEVVRSSPSAPRRVEVVEERINHLLLHYFLEGGGEKANERQRRERAAGILTEILQAPIMLTVPHPNIDECDEFSRVETVVGLCLEVMGIDGLTLVPELSDDARELVIHVF